MYEHIAQTYVLESETQEFLRASNPWALRDTMLLLSLAFPDISLLRRDQAYSISGDHDLIMQISRSREFFQIEWNFYQAKGLHLLLDYRLIPAQKILACHYQLL